MYYIYQSHPQASLHRSSSPRHHHDQQRNRRTPVVAPRHRRSRASALHQQHGSSTVNTLNSHEPHQRPQSHVAFVCFHKFHKSGYFNGDTTCECGLATETMSHMLQCTLLAHPCTLDDLLEFNDTAQACIERWKKIA